jgi:hypothetical protein
MRAKTFGIFLPYALLATIGLLGALFVMKFSLLWTPYAWMALMIIGYGMYSYLVSLAFIYPKFDWEDPRKMTNRKAALPALIGSIVYSIVAIFVTYTIYYFAYSNPALAIPIVIMGLALLAGGTWFFVHARTNRVERAWPGIGAN